MESAPVTFTVVGFDTMKPPFFAYYVDVHVKNEDPEPRWVLLPTSTRQSPLPPPRVKLMPGDRAYERVYLQRFGEWHGPGFYALWVPVGGDIWVRHLAISGMLDDLVAPPCPPPPPDGCATHDASDTTHLNLEVVIARDLIIGNEASNPWYGAVPTGTRVAELTWERGDYVPVFPPGAQEVAIGYEEHRRYTVSVPARGPIDAPADPGLGQPPRPTH